MIATIERGAITNRVRVGGSRSGLRKAPRKYEKRKRRGPPAPTKGFYRQDRSVRGLGCVVVCVSMPRSELVELDAVALRAQMARSHFVRQAVKRFQAFVEGRCAGGA